MHNPDTNPISLFFNAISKHYVGVIAVLLISASTYLWLTEKPFPHLLENLDLMVIAYLFGKNASKNETSSKAENGNT